MPYKDLFQDWVRRNCSIRQQNELAKAIRGPDVYDNQTSDRALQNATVKTLCRALRSCVEIDGNPGEQSSFFKIDAEHVGELRGKTDQFLQEIEKYSPHFVDHFVRAVGVIAYKYQGHENPLKIFWRDTYYALCTVSGHTPESEAQLDTRLKDSI